MHKMLIINLYYIIIIIVIIKNLTCHM